MSFWNTVKSIFVACPPPEKKVDLARAESIIGYHFKDQSLLALALTHRSFTNNSESVNESNERMEFLGDSVLGLLIAEQLFADHPDWHEGELTKMKSLLVNETTLAEIGKDIGLNQHIYLSAEEDKSGGADRSSIVSDAMESVMAAVYLDGGIEAAKKFILKVVYSRKEIVSADSSQRNYKGELLELIQASGKGMPRYDVVSETGPDHDKTFNIVVRLNGQDLGHGIGFSKKEAEQKAAAEALEHINENQD